MRRMLALAAGTLLLLPALAGCELLVPRPSDVCDVVNPDVVACAGPPPTANWPQGRTLTATTWTASTGGVHDFVPGPVRVRFDAPGDLLVDSGCNTLTVDGHLDGLRIVTDTVTSTALPCPSTYGDIEQWLTGFFEEDPYWGLASLDVTLSTPDAEVRLQPEV